MRVKALVVAAISTAASIVSAVAPVRASDLISGKLGIYPGQTFQMNIYVAKAKGFYKDAGVDLSLVPIANGPLMNSMLGSGTIDFALQPPSNVEVAREQGLDEVMIAGDMGVPYVVVGATKLNLPHKGKYPDVIRDLKGLTWGITARGADSEMFMRAMADDAKLDPTKDMTWLGVGLSPTAIPALKAGRVDAFITISPGQNIAAKLGLGQILVDLRKGEGPANFKGIAYESVATLRKTAEANARLVQGIIDAHTKAYCWVRDEKNFDELIEIMKAQMNIPDLSDEQFRQMIHDEIPILKMTFPESSFPVWNEFLLKAKMVREPLDPAKMLWSTVPKSEPHC